MMTKPLWPRTAETVVRRDDAELLLTGTIPVKSQLAALRGAANLAALRGVANIEQYIHLRLHHHLRPRVHAHLRRDPPGERLT